MWHENNISIVIIVDGVQTHCSAALRYPIFPYIREERVGSFVAIYT
jgi:hypothetical protein